jgi:hypothetical protein
MALAGKAGLKLETTLVPCCCGHGFVEVDSYRDGNRTAVEWILAEMFS